MFGASTYGSTHYGGRISILKKILDLIYSLVMNISAKSNIIFVKAYIFTLSIMSYAARIFFQTINLGITISYQVVKWFSLIKSYITSLSLAKIINVTLMKSHTMTLVLMKTIGGLHYFIKDYIITLSLTKTVTKIILLIKSYNFTLIHHHIITSIMQKSFNITIGLSLFIKKFWKQVTQLTMTITMSLWYNVYNIYLYWKAAVIKNLAGYKIYTANDAYTTSWTLRETTTNLFSAITAFRNVKVFVKVVPYLVGGTELNPILRKGIKLG